MGKEKRGKTECSWGRMGKEKTGEEEGRKLQGAGRERKVRGMKEMREGRQYSRKHGWKGEGGRRKCRRGKEGKGKKEGRQVGKNVGKKR